MGQQKIRIDMIGRVFGHLTVVEFAGTDKWGAALWKCVCAKDGNETVVVGGDLRTGKTRSCGCGTEFKGKDNPRYRHGQALVSRRTPEYQTWSRMKQRCINPKNKDYHDYGGRGITVCARWLESFEDFLSDVGTRPSAKHSLDRFPNNNGNYEPGNVRWATAKEQANNRRPHKHIIRVCPHCGENLYKD